MTPAADPYRTLGLPRDASLDEVKRAYRKLAKANHPDAAGPAALPRFLAIQAAYEQLLGGPPLPRGGSGPTRSSAADATRAGATHRAYGGRSRRGRPAGGTAPGGTAPGGTAPGGAAPGGAQGPTAASSGTAGRPGGTGSGRRGAGTGAGSGASAGGGTGASSGSTGSGRPSGSAETGAPRTRGKATLGSTSYDGAEAGPFEPDWGGASWYGTTSGTYWTINPKEYADPRKHGPEYQARARRAARAQAAARAGATADPVADDADAPDRVAADTDADADAASGPDRDEARETGTPDAGGRSGTGHTTASWWETSIGSEPASSTEADVDPRASSARATAAGATGAPARPARSARTARPAASDVDPPPPDLAAAATDLGRALTDERTARGRWRLVQAVVAWLPIAFGLGWLAGEQTGCGRAAASCDGVDPFLGPVLVLLALGVLLLVPRLAALAAAGAIAAIVVAIPAAAVLSATGDGTPAEGRSVALGLILVIAWLVGLSVAIVRRLRVAPASSARPGGPVS